MKRRREAVTGPDHATALEDAAYKREYSNLARAYLDYASRLTAAEAQRDAAIRERDEWKRLYGLSTNRALDAIEKRDRLEAIVLADDAKAIADYEWERANKLVADRDAALARAERAEKALEATRGALPYISAQLRHAYGHLVNGRATDLPRFADGLLAPQIKRLEALAHPAPAEET
jgi:hypothetical protein